MPDVFGEMNVDVRARLEAASMIVGRIRQGLLISVERDDRCVWYDVGWTTRIVGDPTDLRNELFLDVIEIVSGLEARKQMERAS